jgi:uncharacterized membrane protein YdbT with pleckstrin-like domain
VPRCIPVTTAGGKATQCRLLVGNARKRHAFSCESATSKRSTLQQKELHHGEEDKKESESEEEKVIFRIGINLALMPIGLETLFGTLAAGNIQPLFIWTGVPLPARQFSGGKQTRLRPRGDGSL